jgi:hypothetical protein
MGQITLQTELPRRSTPGGATVIILALVVLWAIELAAPQESHAIPAWARKYDADCAMCHYPVVPRLNSFGQQFRRAGYRTQSEFNKDQDLTNVGNFLAARIRAQLAYDNTKGTVERSEFRFPDLSLFYSGALTRNFSAWIHAFSNNSTSVDFHGHVQGIYGSPDGFISVRVGQMHMLQQEGVGGFDRPTGISLPPIQALTLTSTSVLANGAAQAFHFDLRQKGVEVAYVRGAGRLLFQVTNGLNQTGSGTANLGDIDPQKDYLVAYERILDEIASGFTLFYYQGTNHGRVTPGTPTAPTFGAPTSIGNRFDFSRYGFNLSKIFPVGGLGFFEIQGGYIRSHDNNSSLVVSPGQLSRDVEGNAFYVESQQYVTGPELTFFERYSWMDLNAPRPNSTRKDYTIGVVMPIQTRLRTTAEYTYTDNRFSGITGHLALLELQANW